MSVANGVSTFCGEKNSPCYLKNLFVFEIIFSYRQRLLDFLLAVFSAFERVRALSIQDFMN